MKEQVTLNDKIKEVAESTIAWIALSPIYLVKLVNQKKGEHLLDSFRMWTLGHNKASRNRLREKKRIFEIKNTMKKHNFNHLGITDEMVLEWYKRFSANLEFNKPFYHGDYKWWSLRLDQYWKQV